MAVGLNRCPRSHAGHPSRCHVWGGATHYCQKARGHRGGHRCVCKAQWWEEVDRGA